MIGEDLARLLTGPFLAACALLAVAGASKLLRPAERARRARVLHLPAGNTGVRVLGAVELAVARQWRVVRRPGRPWPSPPATRC